MRTAFLAVLKILNLAVVELKPVKIVSKDTLSVEKTSRASGLFVKTFSFLQEAVSNPRANKIIVVRILTGESKCKDTDFFWHAGFETSCTAFERRSRSQNVV